MSTTTNHTITTTDASGAPVEAIATTIQPAPGAPDDASHAPITVIQNPNAEPEKLPFKEQVKGYAKKFAGKTFNNPEEEALGQAKLDGKLDQGNI